MSESVDTTKRHRMRRLPIGAELVDDGIAFRVWAPDYDRVDLVLESGDSRAMHHDGEGHFALFVPGVEARALYRYRLGGQGNLYPDPASRFQPAGVHGPSQVIDPDIFAWTDEKWAGARPDQQVIYEMHIGTFTQEGIWKSAERELPRLADLGITCLEVMPVAQTFGRFNWGYDGVDLFSPQHLYGLPDDFRRFVNAAHASGLAVILDVVYNHLGPVGNYLPTFAKEVFTEKHRNDWGKSINYDDRNSHGVREFVLANVQYWIQEFHIDGYRFDATHAILDESSEHICTAICRTARKAAGRRGVLLIAENEPQHSSMVRAIERGGHGMDALWNDDFHHSAMVALAGHNEGYYSDYRGKPQEFISAAKWGYLYQGQRYKWQGRRRGTNALDLCPTAFVNYIQNHDQIANSGKGLRVQHLTSPQQLRAMTAMLLLMPQTPMLFQGQEFAASSPFYYFADHEAELAKLVREGRARELSEYPSIATTPMLEQLCDPSDIATYERSKLNHDQRHLPFHSHIYAMHKELLRLRREDPVFRRVQMRGNVDGAALGEESLVLRYFGEGGDDRLVIMNLGRDVSLVPAPEPLLAPPTGKRWTLIFSSEDPKYDGSGTPWPDTEKEGWFLTGRCTIVLKPADGSEAEVGTRIVRAGASGPRPRGEP